MRVINPIGRKIDSVAAAHGVARGCMCGSWTNYANSRTTTDNCSHCGCNCKEEDGDTTRYSTNNYTIASDASRSSV